MDFIDSFFVANANDVDFEKATNYVHDCPSQGVSNVVGRLFDSIVQEDYFNLYVYGNSIDEEVNLNVDGDNNEEINHRFKDLDAQELENVKAGGCCCNIHFEIWATNPFDAWWKYKKLDTSLLIIELHASEPKLLVNYLLDFLLQVTKKNGELYPPIMFSFYSCVCFIC
jgi:hypothetical protein